MSVVKLIRETDATIEKHSWGRIHWFAGSGEGRSEEMTFGKCIIEPDCNTRQHYHPNCEEILHVVEGFVRHHVAGEEEFMELGPGDTIVIPPEVKHHAENVGSVEAELIVVYSSPEKESYAE